MANDYTITRDPETGLQVVRFNGTKIGQTQTPAGAQLIRRNHRRRTATVDTSEWADTTRDDMARHQADADRAQTMWEWSRQA
jgi:hypothetical protein